MEQHAPATQQDMPARRAGTIIALVTFVGLALRAMLAWRLPLIGDEVGTWIVMARDYRYILTHFFDPWLTMGPFIAGTKLVGAAFGDNPLVLRLPVVVAGALAIPFAAGVTRRMGGTNGTACIVALLVAVNPFLVAHGANLRSYSFVILATVAALHFLLAWFDRPRWSVGWACAAMCALALLSHFCTAYFIAFLGAVFAWRTLARRSLRGTASLIVPMLVMLALAAAFYLPILDDLLAFRRTWGGEPPTPVHYLADLTSSFFAPGWLALPALALLLGGWIADVRRAPGRAAIVGAGVAIPMLLYAASGSQHFPWGSTRFLIFLLPLLLIQIGFALEAMVRWCRTRAIVLLVLVATWVPGIQNQFAKADHEPWREVQAFLNQRMTPGAAIMAPGHAHLHLMPGFGSDPARLVYARDYLAPDAEGAGGGQTLFVVTVGAKLEGADASRRFGKIEVATYRGPDRSSLATRVARDYRRVFHGQARPDQAALAQDALALMRALGWSVEEQRDMERTYYHSFIRSSRGQFMPPRLRDVQFP